MATTIAQNYNNVISAKPVVPAGGVLIGTSSFVAPTDAVAALTGVDPLGFISDSGVSMSNSITTKKEKAWGGTVVKVMSTDASAEMAFEVDEFLNATALRAVFGDANVTVTPAGSGHGNQIALRFTGELPPPAPYLVEAKDANRRIRVYVPLFQVAEPGDIEFTDDEIMKMSVKGEALKDENGVLYYLFTDDGATA